MDLPDNLRSLGDLRSRYRRTRRGTQADGVAFVFQGGGSLSAPQVGMLRALSEAGVQPDLVVGSSAGALNAVAFAADPTQAGVERLEAVWMSLRRRKVAQFSARTLLAAALGRGDGLVPNSGLRDLLRSAALPATLDGTPIPAHVVATDLGSGAAVVLSDGQTGPGWTITKEWEGYTIQADVAFRDVRQRGAGRGVWGLEGLARRRRHQLAHYAQVQGQRHRALRTPDQSPAARIHASRCRS